MFLVSELILGIFKFMRDIGVLTRVLAGRADVNLKIVPGILLVELEFVEIVSVVHIDRPHIVSLEKINLRQFLIHPIFGRGSSHFSNSADAAAIAAAIAAA